MTGRFRQAAPILILGLLPFLFFWPLTLGQATLAQGDFLEQYYPLRLYAARSLARGQLALWNPYINGGQPALADPQTSALYPPSIVMALLASPWDYPLRALEIEVLAHLSLAAVFTYLFAKQVLQSGVAAFVSAIAFACGGYITSFPIAQVTILESAAWLPVVLWLVSMGYGQAEVGGWSAPSRQLPDSAPPAGTANSGHRCRLTRLPWAYSTVAGLFLGVAFLAGHPQTALYVGLCVALYWLWIWSARPGLQALVSLACLSLASLAVAAPQLLPTVEYASQSTRQMLSYQAAATGLQPQELWALLAPLTGGNPALYVGMPALLLAPLSLCLGKGRREMAFWALMAAFAVLLALGDRAFLYPLLHRLVPGLGLLREQERALVLFSLAAAVLAGGGARAVLDVRWGRAAAGLGLVLATACAMALWAARDLLPPPVHEASARVLVLVLAVGLGLLWRWLVAARRTRAVGLLALLLLADLYVSPGHIALTAASGERQPAPDGIVRLLQEAASEGPAFRVSSEGLLPVDGNAGILFGLEDVVGNTPMELTSYRDLLNEVPEWQWWHLLNVRFVVTRRALTHGALGLVRQQGDVRLYEIHGWGPRAWLVHETRSVATRQDALRLVSSPDFTWDRLAAVEGGPEFREVSPADSVEVLQTDAHRLQVRVDNGAPGYLLISQNAYPGWWAFVDGRPTQVFRANGWQPAVHLTPGRHTVDLVYVPPSLMVGLSVSVLVMALFLVVSRSRSPSRSADEAEPADGPERGCASEG